MKFMQATLTLGQGMTSLPARAMSVGRAGRAAPLLACASKALLAHLRGLGEQGVDSEVSVGWAVTARTQALPR